jgi:large subunit ribosomal protein L10
MPKTRVQKEEISSKLADRLERSASAVFVTIQGVKVTEVEDIRNALFPNGLQLQVAKNSLLKRVMIDRGIEVPAGLLDQPVALVFGYEDPIASPKAMAPFAKEIEALEIVGGLMDGKFITPAEVRALAVLPSREQLLGQLVGTLAAPMRGLVTVMSGNIRGLVTALAAIRDQKA